MLKAGPTEPSNPFFGSAILSNRQIYEWEDAEVKKVIRALREAVSSVESRFESPKGKMAGGFKL